MSSDNREKVTMKYDVNFKFMNAPSDMYRGFPYTLSYDGEIVINKEEEEPFITDLEDNAVIEENNKYYRAAIYLVIAKSADAVCRVMEDLGNSTSIKIFPSTLTLHDVDNGVSIEVKFCPEHCVILDSKVSLIVDDAIDNLHIQNRLSKNHKARHPGTFTSRENEVDAHVLKDKIDTIAEDIFVETIEL